MECQAGDPYRRPARRTQWLLSALAHHYGLDRGVENEIVVLATGLDQYLQEVFHHLDCRGAGRLPRADFRALCAVLGLRTEGSPAGSEAAEDAAAGGADSGDVSAGEGDADVEEEARLALCAEPPELTFRQFHARLCGYFGARAGARLPRGALSEHIETQIRRRGSCGRRGAPWRRPRPARGGCAGARPRCGDARRRPGRRCCAACGACVSWRRWRNRCPACGAGCSSWRRSCSATGQKAPSSQHPQEPAQSQETGVTTLRMVGPETQTLPRGEPGHRTAAPGAEPWMKWVSSCSAPWRARLPRTRKKRRRRRRRSGGKRRSPQRPRPCWLGPPAAAVGVMTRRPRSSRPTAATWALPTAPVSRGRWRPTSPGRGPRAVAGRPWGRRRRRQSCSAGWRRVST